MHHNELSTSTNDDPKPTLTTYAPLSRRHSLLRWALATILALATLHLLAGFAARGRLRQAQERAGAQGHSLKYRDFAPPDVTPGENATDFVEAAVLLLPAQRSTESPASATLADELTRRLDEIDRRGAALTPEDLALFRRAVDRYEVALRVLDEGMLLERARFDVDYSWSVPASLEIPNLLARHRLAGLLRARARLALDDGRPEDAYREAAKIFRLAGWCAQEMPTLIQVLIATQIAQRAMATTYELMQLAPPSAEARTHLLASARQWDPRQIYDRSLAAERAATFSTLLDERAWDDLERTFPRPFRRPWIHWNAAVFSDAMTDLIAACTPPAYLRQAGREHGRRYLPARWATLARRMLPNFLQACGKRDALVARLDLMEIAFALEGYREQAGGFPPALDRLADIPATDPFSGQPYRYHLDTRTAAVYSIAGNGVDDGGTPPPPESMKSAPELIEGDIVWSLPLTSEAADTDT